MASITDLDRQNQRLKTQVQDLINELEDKEKKVILSAQFGKQLLDSNSELNRQLEEIQESNLVQLEELRQENYSLKMKIEGDVRARENFTIELDNLKAKLQEDAKHELSCVTGIHSKKVDELAMEIEALHAEIEKSTLVTEQLQEKVSKQDEMLTEAHKYSKQLQQMGVLETTVEELKEECVLMRFKNDELNIMLTDANDSKQQLLFDQQNLVQKIETLKENFGEKTIQAKTWFDALQDTRQQVSELQMEVSVLKAEARNRSHKEKGNSLFGEVEDKRLQLQQQYTTISTKYESLQKTHQIVKRQLHQYKSQILPMLQMAGNRADYSKSIRLEAALSQSRSEIQRLCVKIRDLEKENGERGLSTSLENLHDIVTGSKDKKDYFTLLQNEISSLKETIADLKSKGEITALKLLAVTDKRRETESHLHTSEVKKEKLEHDVVRLRLKLEELTIKLQDGKSTEQRDPLSARKLNKRSIWKDTDIFTKTETPHENLKDSTLEKPRTVRRPANVTDESLHSTKVNNIKNNHPNVAECAKLISSKNIKSFKPTGIIPPKEVGDAETILPKEIKSVASAEILPPKEVGDVETLLPKEVKPVASVEVSTPGKAKPVGRVAPMSGLSPNKENGKKLKRHGTQHGRVIHVKKDVGSKNECQQQ